MALPDQVFRQTLATFLEPIAELLADPSVSEIMINGPNEVYIERKGRLSLVSHRFPDEDRLMAAVKNIAQFVGRPIDRFHPALDGRLPDGSRIHVLLPPASRKGVVVSIRKFFNDALDLEALLKHGSLTPASASFLHGCVNMGKNILISGGTGSGKTSLLNVLSGMIAPGERMIVIEDATELQLRQPHVLSFETQHADSQGRGALTMRDLFRSAMRLRPDRVVLGEIRGGEAVDVIQAMTSGHAGSMSTIHASTAFDALQRLETLALMGGLDIPQRVLRSQIASAIDVVIQVARLKDGSRRVMTISEVVDLSSEGQYVVSDLFNFVVQSHTPTQISGQLLPEPTHPSFLDDLLLIQDSLPSRLPWQ